MRVGQPCVKREQRDLDRKSQCEREKDKRSCGCKTAGKAQMPKFDRIRKQNKIKGRSLSCLVGIDVIKGDDGSEHQQSAECGKDKEFNRRVNAILTAPNSDEKKHRDQ